MFKPVPMSRASIVILERDERTVLRLLGRLGVLQLTRTPAGPDNAPLPPPDFSHALAQCERLITRVQEIRRSLQMGSDSKSALSAVELSLSQAEGRVIRLEKIVGSLAKRRQQLAKRAGELKTVSGQLLDYCGLGIPLDQTDESSFLHFVTGSLPPDNLENLQSQIGDNTAIVPLPAQKNRQPLMIMTTRQGRSALESALRQAGFHDETLPVASGETVDTVNDENRREMEELSAKLERLEARRKLLAEKTAPALSEIEFAVETERSLLKAGQNFLRTESALLLTGWIPSARSSEMENHLREITHGRFAIKITAPQNLSDEEIPVLFRNPRWLRPFEMLVTAYGLPQYHELEPTLFVAVSYLLMFGMMFGDVGHGAVLTLGGLAARLAGRTEPIRRVGRLLMFAGGASMIFGALYGSCFGIEALKKFALWHDPLADDPMSLMIGAIEIGIAMISLGLVLNIINRFRHGDFFGGFLGKFGIAGAVFYWGTLALLMKFAAVQASGLVVPLMIAVLVLPIAGWMLKEPFEIFCSRRAGKSIAPGRSMGGAFTESLVGAFEGVLGYFANTISFVRLAAYALSHAAILLATFLMADAVKQVSPAGTFLSVLIIVLGNTVAIALEGVVASVQALRLEYYEFFGKFFSGRGQPFSPFCLQTKTVAESPL